MRSTIKFLILAASIALAQSLPAVPMTGALSFSGTAKLDGVTVDLSTQVKNWGSANTVDTSFGSFAGLNGAAVNLIAPWNFYSGSIANFWNVGGFQFNLSSSSTFDDYAGVLTVIFAGTVMGNSYDPTPFLGRVKIYDPGTADQYFKYTQSLDFVTTPDGGTTAALLGLTVFGLALVRRKVVAI